MRQIKILSMSCVLLSSSMVAYSADTVHPPEIQSSQIISIGNDALLNMNQADRQRLEIQSLSKNSTSSNDIAIVKIPESKIKDLSAYMHTNHHRCGGYVWHRSEAAADQFVEKISRENSQAQVDYSIDNSQTVYALLAQVVSSNLNSTVSELGAFNNRYYSQPSGEEAALWLKTNWESIATTRDDITVELYDHASWVQPSVIATIVGQSLPDEVVIIGGHLDSINGSSPSFGRAPGHDDNASGIAVVTETLRAIAQSGFKPERTIKLMGYAAEEVGLRGSGEIADEYAAEGIDVVGVAQFDMTGFKGTASKDIVFMTDFTNAAQNQFMANLLDFYFPEVEYGNSQCGYGCSDHASWFANGFPASMPFESTFNDYNQDIHSSGDDHFDVGHAINFLRLSLAYTAELAKGDADSFESTSRIEFSQATADLEEQSSISIVVSRTGLLDQSATVNYQTLNGSGVAGENFEAASGTLEWGVNDASDKVVQITALDLSEDKNFLVELTDVGGNGELGETKSMAIQLINNSVSKVSFQQSTLEMDESTTTAITIKRIGDIDQAASVSFQAVNASAIAGTDYQAVSGILNWDAGENSDKTLELNAFSVEQDKSFIIELRNATGNAELGDTRVLEVTIVDKTSTTNPSPEEPVSSSGGGSMSMLLLLTLLLRLRNRR